MNVYLDHAATTPMLPEVIEYFTDILKEYPGNASSLHHEGQRSRKVYKEAKQKIANCINCECEEIIFTSGGTEADNLAIMGYLKAIKDNYSEKKHIITTQIEHEAVLETFKELSRFGYEVDFAPVDKNGMVDVDYLKEKITEKTALCSIMYANNEVGTIEPIERISEICRSMHCVLHTDAVQAAGKIKIDVRKLGVDMLSVSAHKFYGPKGVGFLFMKKDLPLRPIIFGGGHENGLRSGTENIPGIAAMAKALEITHHNLSRKTEQYNKWVSKILKTCDEIGGVRLNGHAEKRTPGTLSLSFSGINGEALMGMLSMDGIAVSTASACSSHSHQKGGSYVLAAMQCPVEYINGTIRVVLGYDNTDQQVDFFCEKLKERVELLRRLSNG
jgi:cysteine desulfurase